MPVGRKPTPTRLKVLKGERPDRINHDEPQPGSGIPQCPSTDPEVRKVWDYMVDQLSRMQVITMADRDSLDAYCQAVVQHRRATEILNREGFLIEGAYGTKKHPAATIQREALMAMKQFGGEFGLTPAARTRIKVADSKPQQEQGASRLLSS